MLLPYICDAPYIKHMCAIFSHLFLNCDGGVNKICSGLSSRDDFDAGADNETFRALMTIETDILLETYAKIKK